MMGYSNGMKHLEKGEYRMKKLVLLIMLVLAFITGCTNTENKSVLKEIKRYNNDLNKKINYINDEGIYMFYAKKESYIIFYGKNKEYSNITEEISNNVLTINFDSNESISSKISAYKVTSSAKFDTILLKENGEDIHFNSIIN